MGMSQMCTGAGDYFRTSKPHSEKLCSFKPGLCVVYNLSFMFPCVLDVPVALHLERLAACYMLAAAPGTDRDYSTARILAGGCSSCAA